MWNPRSLVKCEAVTEKAMRAEAWPIAVVHFEMRQELLSPYPELRWTLELSGLAEAGLWSVASSSSVPVLPQIISIHEHEASSSRWPLAAHAALHSELRTIRGSPSLTRALHGSQLPALHSGEADR